MLFPLLTSAALATAAPSQGQFVVPTSQGAPERPGILRQVDEHGIEATAFVDQHLTSNRSAVSMQSAFSAANWSAQGPFGGDVEDIGVSPVNDSVVLAGLAPSSGQGTMYRSTDGGASWSEVASMAGMSVYDIEFVSGTTAYAGTIDGVWRSTDGGATWTNLPLGIGVNDQVFEITQDPNNAATLWVGVASANGLQSNTLLKSTDSGASWTPMVPAGGPYSFSGVTIDPADSNKVIACWQGAFGGGGVFVSADGGASWVDRSAGLPGNPMNDVVHTGSSVLLCGGQLFGGQIVGVYETTNDGVTWTELSDAGWPNRAITDIELDPASSAHIWCSSQGAGVLESSDGGATWSHGVGGTGSLSSNCVTYAPSDTSVMFTGSASNAVWKSSNGGGTFAPSSVGIGQLDVYSVATNPLNPQQVAIAYQGLNNGGVQLSNDGGTTWTGAALPGTRYNTVGFDHNGTLYAISDGPTTVGAEGLYRFSGGSWTSIGPDQGSAFESELFALAFDPADATGNTILSGGGDFGVAGFEPTAWLTTDGGANWIKTHEGTVDFERLKAIAFSTAGSGTFVASYTDTSGTQTGGAMRSVDGGASWTDSSAGLPAGCQGEGLSVHPNGSTVLLADSDAGTGNGGLHRSTDGGQTWSAASAPEGTTRVAHDPSSASELITTHFGAPRVRISSDGGATQGDYTAGIPASAFLRDLHVTASGGASFVATNQGVFKNDNEIGSNYCGTTPNSVGSGALISAAGSASVAANNLVLQATACPPNRPGVFFYGAAQASVPLGNGIRCVDTGGVGLFRYDIVFINGAGNVSYGVDYNAQTNPLGVITAGSTWNFQFWYRDPTDPPAGFNLSDALEVIFGA